MNNRPSNLEYVTPGDNVRHAVRTGLNPVQCENNAATKLSNQDVFDIRDSFLAGVSRRELSDRYGVTLTTICAILKGKVFKALNLESLTNKSQR